MLPCFGSLPPPSAENAYFSSPISQENTPISSVPFSPTVNLTREFSLAVQTDSYGEIRTIFDQESYFNQTAEVEQVEVFEEHVLLEQVLQPSRDCVQEALSVVESNSLTQLVASYFEYSENATRFCLLLYQSVYRTRLFYTPIHNLLDDLPLEFDSSAPALSHSQCIYAFDVFLKFDCLDNPFISFESHNFDNIRQCFSEFGQQLDHHLGKLPSKLNLRRHCATGPAFCIIATGVGIAVAAVAIASHALVALVASPLCPIILKSYTSKKETGHLAQLDSAAKGAYLLHKDLDTIDRLVAQLHSDVENDKLLIHLGVGRGVDRYFIQEVLKQLRRNRSRFVQQLVNLEDHLFICFAAVNRARKHLLQEISVHLNSFSD